MTLTFSRTTTTTERLTLPERIWCEYHPLADREWWPVDGELRCARCGRTIAGKDTDWERVFLVRERGAYREIRKEWAEKAQPIQDMDIAAWEWAEAITAPSDTRRERPDE